MSKNIVFFLNQICGRGTTDIVYNLAKYNQILLNNNSKILTLKKLQIQTQSICN